MRLSTAATSILLATPATALPTTLAAADEAFIRPNKFRLAARTSRKQRIHDRLIVQLSRNQHQNNIGGEPTTSLRKGKQRQRQHSPLFGVLENSKKQSQHNDNNHFQECDPNTTEPDIGILGCGVHEYCMESQDSSTTTSLGGICVNDDRRKRDLQVDEFVPNTLCDPTTDDYGTYDCDCSNFDVDANLGTFSCVVDDYNCFADNVCGTFTITNTNLPGGIEKVDYCYDLIAPYEVTICYSQDTVPACNIAINGISCNSCRVVDGVVDPVFDFTSYGCYEFDCSNTPVGIAGNDCLGDYVLQAILETSAPALSTAVPSSPPPNSVPGGVSPVAPTTAPATSPVAPTVAPTAETTAPTSPPTAATPPLNRVETPSPISSPIFTPALEPTAAPTASPTAATVAPTVETMVPTSSPTAATPVPSVTTSSSPTAATPSPTTSAPSSSPTVARSVEPTLAPSTKEPTSVPTKPDTPEPSAVPSQETMSSAPSLLPSSEVPTPTTQPSIEAPYPGKSSRPSSAPSRMPVPPTYSPTAVQTPEPSSVAPPTDRELPPDDSGAVAWTSTGVAFCVASVALLVYYVG